MSLSLHRCIGDIAGCLLNSSSALPTLCRRAAPALGCHVTPVSSFRSSNRTSSQSSVPSLHAAASSTAGLDLLRENSASAEGRSPPSPTSARRSETPRLSIHRASLTASRSSAVHPLSSIPPEPDDGRGGEFLR